METAGVAGRVGGGGERRGIVERGFYARNTINCETLLTFQKVFIFYSRVI